MIELRGIAWNHSRGFTSVVATGQRFEELHPEVRITWEKRSLQAFADASMEDLAARYDLIVMDHPHTAVAATDNLLLPLDELLPEDFLADQAAHSVGASHESYRFHGHQWTLATDAATPIATWRPDLVAKHGLTLPATWEDVLSMAREGLVTVSAFPIDVLMHTYMFTQAAGHAPFSTGEGIGPVDTVAGALEELKRLVDLCDPACLERDPIRTAEWMSAVEDDPRATMRCSPLRPMSSAASILPRVVSPVIAPRGWIRQSMPPAMAFSKTRCRLSTKRSVVRRFPATWISRTPPRHWLMRRWLAGPA
jgi:multiple sugar transport system substrate-binding protein